MDDLFKKLNVLVKSGLNDLLGEGGNPRRKPLSPDRLGQDIDDEIAALRARINEAVAYEEQLKARVQQLAHEVARWDAQADEAVTRQDDVNARYFIDHLKRAQQRQTMAEGDVYSHQLVTRELIMRVNTLEAAVADARRARGEPAPDETAQPGRNLSDVLRDARERINNMGDVLAAKDEQAAASTPSAAPSDQQAIEDDLSKRRQRLSR